MSNIMTFKVNGDGNLLLVKDGILDEMRKPSSMLSNHNYIESDEPKSLLSKLSEKSKGIRLHSIAPLPLLLATTATGGSGVFWDAFMTYIFPWMLDIAKVFCAIKIAQGFYQEKRGGRDEGTGFGSLVTYGKWYLVFWLIPWGVELIDQIGGKMLNDLRSGSGM